jgi:DNA-binding GntR family transcriptional regulator
MAERSVAEKSPDRLASCHGTLRLQVYERLREGILLGKYPRGSALTELRIAAELGVSRTPVREAFCQLELDGLVSFTPNKGVVVEGFDQNDLLDLYVVRSQMESLAAARAARQMTDDQINLLREAYQQEEIYVREDNMEAMQKSDAIFHNLIFNGSGSKILQNILSPINSYTRQARFISLSTKGRSAQVLSEHKNILEAIEKHDAVMAEQYMQTHIANAAASFKKLADATGGSQ